MKQSRRNFIRTGITAGAGLLVAKKVPGQISKLSMKSSKSEPIIVSTWQHGLAANKKAMELLSAGKNALDAVEYGVRTAEDNPEVSSVGYGGYPDMEGHLTLDASIMDWNGNAGAVAFIEGIKNPISVARLVMEKTNHVLLVGEGAKRFALANGFKEENLLTEKARDWWLKHKTEQELHDREKKINEEHDTIGLIVIDTAGNIAGGVSTSGLSFKLPGRVGDSPIIGAGLYVDNEVGGACSTGVGEWAIKTVGSFLVVEKMREGLSPQEACEIAVKRLKKSTYSDKGFQLAYLAVNKEGVYGAYSTRAGFTYCVTDTHSHREYDSTYFVDSE